MHKMALLLGTAGLAFSMGGCNNKNINFDQYPSTVIANDEVEMRLYLPDTEKGLYRATRFDWSGVIGSVKYKGHDYFAYWKDSHDPLFHEDLSGPVEGFIAPGLGYAEADPGGSFVRIGVGVIEKENEAEYNWRKTYRILDHGKWNIEQGADWISFTHTLESDPGYAYIYNKTIRLSADGFTIEHSLQNMGSRIIETDQFNHNFFMIDGVYSGPAFKISFPYPISTDDDLEDLLEINDSQLTFQKELEKDEAIFVELEGYGQEAVDHQVTIINEKSGAGVSFSVDRPLHRMAFWACRTTLSPENSIWISAEPGKEEQWKSVYTLFEY
jgi:hypothetical protein